MKDKNRFSILLEHLMTIAELKNSILAKAVQYDDSYISKWISGKLLPTEKNHENTLQAISHCIVEALSEESTTQLLQECADYLLLVHSDALSKMLTPVFR